jgi:hypothetical protein
MSSEPVLGNLTWCACCWGWLPQQSAVGGRRLMGKAAVRSRQWVGGWLGGVGEWVSN